MRSLAKKSLIINLIQRANSQPAIKKILDQYYSHNDTSYVHTAHGLSKITDRIDQMLVFLATNYDIDYKIGVDSNIASDGNQYDFGDGKFAIQGDNIPATLSNAKNAIINSVKEY